MIYNTDQEFEFNHLVLKTPAPYSGGGGHFIKYTIHDSPLYIKPPKCHIKLLAKSSNKKRINCDLQFSRESEDFIQWIENLENHTRNILYDNREKWFDSDLEVKDIENSFVSSLKPYKSAKFYIMRTGIPMKDDSISIKIYDEEENIVVLENLKENTEVVTIMECKGVRCSSRNFQIEFEVKQMMVQESKNLFEKCILTSSLKSSNMSPIKELRIKTNVKTDSEPIPQPDVNAKTVTGNLVEDSNIVHVLNSVNEKTPESLGEKQPTTDSIGQNIDNTKIDPINTQSTSSSSPVTATPERGGLNVQTSKNELCEVEFNLEEMPELESVQLKKRNEVYYEMYREARRKAKVARDLALSAYLEAKRIKNTYMLDNLKDSDESDNDLNDNDDDDDDDDDDDEDIESENIEDEN